MTKTALGNPDDDGEDILRPLRNTSIGGQAFFSHQTGGTYPYYPMIPANYPTTTPYVTVPATTTSVPSHIKVLLARKDISRVEFDSTGNVIAIVFFPLNDEDETQS